MTNTIKTVLKRLGQDPEAVGIGTDLKTWQSIVEGHCETIIVGAEHGYRMTIICNEDGKNSYNSHRETKWKRDIPLSLNFLFPGGIAIRGHAFIAKLDTDGNAMSLTESETKHWMDFLSHATVRLPSEDVNADTVARVDPATEPALVREPYGGLSDTHQVILLPEDSFDSDGHKLSPEQQIDSIAEQVGYRYKLVPVSNGDIYGVALTCLDSQGLEYELDDESSMLLSLPDVGRKYLRVIEIVGLDRPS